MPRAPSAFNQLLRIVNYAGWVFMRQNTVKRAGSRSGAGLKQPLVQQSLNKGSSSSPTWKPGAKLVSRQMDLLV